MGTETVFDKFRKLELERKFTRGENGQRTSSELGNDGLRAGLSMGSRRGVGRVREERQSGSKVGVDGNPRELSVYPTWRLRTDKKRWRSKNKEVR